MEITYEDLISKRTVLKELSSVYDLLGILSPAVIPLKLLFQEICILKLDWDVPLPAEFTAKWKKLIGTLIKFDIISIPRFYLKMHLTL